MSRWTLSLGAVTMGAGAGIMLDAGWAGAVVAGARVYPAEAYRAAFTLCFTVAVASVIPARLVTETRCRNIWARPPMTS